MTDTPLEMKLISPSLHDQIMWLPCDPAEYTNVNMMLAYKEGHRDARHAAAELVAAHEAEQAAPVAVPDEREAFEAKFPVPSDCRRVGNTYAATEFNAWQANAYGEIRKGWLAALEWRESSAPSSPTPPAQQPAAWISVDEPFHGAAGIEAGEWDIQCDGKAIDELAAANSPGRIPLYAAPPAQQSQWVAVSERLPERGKDVLASYAGRYTGRVFVIRAEYVAPRTEESTDPDIESVEYDEESDTYYLQAGWYERINNWGDYSTVHVTEGEVSHWMPLPAAPGDTAAPEQTEQPYGTTSDKYRAELYDEVWQKARDMGYGNVTEALVELERINGQAEQPTAEGK
ncbi:DUF551 domain-containing protein [Azotobacter salinestris]|uniref:DUF551 domain-containing protein n=1 Tax=Azotobacter salinestris TaxID=69964 RepID=UPI001266ACA6|nr:DUF551 domain-containing protein [Azotobacter salinestris]